MLRDNGTEIKEATLEDVKEIIRLTGITKCENQECGGCSFDSKPPEASEFNNCNICMLLNQVYRTIDKGISNGVVEIDSNVIYQREFFEKSENLDSFVKTVLMGFDIDELCQLFKMYETNVSINPVQVIIHIVNWCVNRYNGVTVGIVDSYFTGIVENKIKTDIINQDTINQILDNMVYTPTAKKYILSNVYICTKEMYDDFRNRRNLIDASVMYIDNDVMHFLFGKSLSGGLFKLPDFISKIVDFEFQSKNYVESRSILMITQLFYNYIFQLKKIESPNKFLDEFLTCYYNE